MRRRSLSIQIWIWFMTVILGICICMGIIFYFAIENFFEEQLYSQIEYQQQSQIVQGSIVSGENQSEQVETSEFGFAMAIDSDNIKHELIPIVNLGESQAIEIENYDQEIIGSNLESINIGEEINIANDIILQASTQEYKVQRYEKNLGSDTLVYVISKQDIDNEPTLIYSYVVKNFKQMIISQFGFVFIGIIMILIISLFLARILAKRITRPLTSLEQDMQKIAKRQWQDPINSDGPKEILSLSKSCERMRRQLIIHDKNQQDLLQSFSHELKTPIMVIRSYLEAIRDGFYPSGNLEESLSAIDNEALRLEKRTLDLIYISNLDYRAYQNQNYEIIDIKDILLGVYERMKYKTPNLRWDFDLEKAQIKANPKHWEIVFENLIQNQLRYSQNSIGIRIDRKDSFNYEIKISNDGPEIEEYLLNKIFLAFEKGKDGESGLGLAIVKRIIDIYDGNIIAKNINKGVQFIINVPLDIDK